MPKEIANKNHYIKAASVFVLCLLMFYLLPFLGANLNSSLLFFAPQLLFPYGDFVARNQIDSRAIFTHRVAILLDFTQWGLASIGFAWFARRMNIGRMVLTAVALIVVFGIVVNVGFALFGISVELDGP